MKNAPRLTGELVVGVTRFKEGVPLASVQDCVDRLWRRHKRYATLVEELESIHDPPHFVLAALRRAKSDD